ncbi:hypothetical protein AES38_15165 (plasmid) [Clavibacter capsici]|nr:hypothetical protein AES38_15165 [Clavibacter capsici]
MAFSLTSPAMCETPLFHLTVWAHSRPYEMSSGCTLAYRISVFRNHNVVAGVAALSQVVTCGR